MLATPPGRTSFIKTLSGRGSLPNTGLNEIFPAVIIFPSATINHIKFRN